MPAAMPQAQRSNLRQTVTIAVMAFLTVVDLFATQALLPSLTAAYGTTPAKMSVAVNASTLGMAVSSLAIALFGGGFDRRRGVVAALLLLGVPTALLSFAPDLTTFAVLRVTQGVLMAAAFSLTLAYLGEHCTAQEAGSAFAAYITGNVASNLFGRLMAAAFVDHLGLGGNFLAFAVLNVAGAVLAATVLERTPKMASETPRFSPFDAVAAHLADPALRAAFVIGFCILFSFIGVFTFVNFVLSRPPIGLGMMSLGFVYFVFLPSVFTTPVAGGIASRFGVKRALTLGLCTAGVGLLMLLAGDLVLTLAGLTLVGVGTFFAQATATGFVGRQAKSNRAAASGLYLAAYFLGGLIGSAVLGPVFDMFGWAACVAGVGCALLVAQGMTLTLPASPRR